MAYSDSKGAIGLLEVPSWCEVARAEEKTAACRRALAFTPDAKQLLTGHLDSTIRIRDVPSLATIGQLKGHTDEVRRLAIHPDGTTLATASNDHTVRLWHLPTRMEIGVLDAAGGKAVECDFAPDDLRLIAVRRRIYWAKPRPSLLIPPFTPS